MNNRLISAVLVTSLCAIAHAERPHAATPRINQPAIVKVVYVQNNEIFTLTPNGQPQQRTTSRIRKYLPLWSPDGTRIAYLQDIDWHIAAGNVIVIDGATGKTIHSVLICPKSKLEVCLINSADYIEWLPANRIAVSGFINPSTSQTFIYSAHTGEYLDDYTDDASGPVFSPDGKLTATVNGMPHFTSESDMEPELDIDHNRIFPAQGVHVRFLSAPVWSSDSARIAIATRGYSSKRRNVIVCALAGSCQSTALPPKTSGDGDPFHIEWHGDRILAASSDGTWSLHPGDPHAMKSSHTVGAEFDRNDKAAIQTEMEIERGGPQAASLLQQVRQSHGTMPDFWSGNVAAPSHPQNSSQ